MEMNIFVVKDLQPLIFRQLDASEDLQVFRRNGKDLYMIAAFGRAKEPLNAPQELSYNNCLKIERLIIERCFGQLTRRFPTLQGRVRVHLEFVPSVIVACCIMHNVPKYLQDPALMISLVMRIYLGLLDHYTLHANAFFERCVFFSYRHRG